MPSPLAHVLGDLPAEHGAFDGSEYPMPVSQAILGALPDMGELRRWLEAAEGLEPEEQCEPAAVAAEVLESQRPDRAEFFLDDGRVRSAVFQGAKWRAGWVLVAGDGNTDDLVRKLKDSQYIVFSPRHEGMRDHALPLRETGAIYFLQLMMRYAMIWGQIAPGDDHEMGHFLERDMPGGMIVCGEIGPLEGLVLLAIMKMGCPAVVTPGFRFDVGPRAAARTDDEMLEALASFPNMRRRVIDGQVLSLPHGADPSHARESFEPVRAVTGILQLRQGTGLAGTTVSGDPSSSHVAVIIEVTDDKLDLPVSAHLEAQAVGYGSMLVESLLAVLALIAVAYMASDRYAGFMAEGGGGPVAAFSDGLGALIGELGLPAATAKNFVALAVSAFALTSLDTATRLSRFAFQEFFEPRRTAPPSEDGSAPPRKPSPFLARSRVVATTVSVALAGTLALSGSWKKIWPIFGSANQLLAALAFLAVSVWLARRARQNLFTIIPMFAMFAVTLTSLTILAKSHLLEEGGNRVLGVVAVLLFAVAVVLATMSMKVLFGKKREAA